MNMAHETAIFPRSIDRGLIEAVREWDICSVVRLFPRSIDRGLIEASPLCRSATRVVLFPRSIDRGLIEAMLESWGMTTDGSFRDQLIAASLKPETGWPHEPAPLGPFRDQLIAASLKRLVAQLVRAPR